MMIKSKIDKRQQNINCKLCGNKDKLINYSINECRKLV